METSENRDRVNKLGDYFVYHNIRKRFNLTFEQFVEKVNNGSWKEFITTHQSITRFRKKG